MLLPELWDRCCQWIEATTSWRESRARNLTHLYFAEYRSGNSRASYQAISAHLVALAGKKGELRRLIENVEQAYDELVRAPSARYREESAGRAQNENGSIVALLKQVGNELEDEIRDWRGELQSLGIPQAEPGVSLPSSLLASLKALLPGNPNTQNSRALSYNFRIPGLQLRRSRQRRSSTKKKGA